MTVLKSEREEMVYGIVQNDITEKDGSWIEKITGSIFTNNYEKTYRIWSTDDETLPSGYISYMKNQDVLKLVYRRFSHTINGFHSTFQRIDNNTELETGSNPYDGDWHDYVIEIKRSGNRLYLK